MGINVPASNKIHSLPVLVNYHLPCSSDTFAALFDTPQQVYVHANTASKVNSAGGQDETWGSIPLKTVMQGVIRASPEIHPDHPATVDRSVYVLDTRETILRRQRSAIPSHMRTDRASSPATPHSSQSSPSSTTSSSTAGEVWSGKGLVSWALNEPGQGKTLITGRLVRSPTFPSSQSAMGGLSALEALEMTGGEGSWGLEVNISLRPQGMPMTGPLPGAEGYSLSSASSQADTPVKRGHSVAPVPANVVDLASSPAASLATRSQPPRSAGIIPQSAATPASSSTSTRKPRASTTTRKRKAPSPAKTDERALNNLETNDDTLVDRNPDFDPKLLLPSIPAAVYNNPASLTKDQVHRLLASPAFLDLLEKTAGQTLAESSNVQAGLAGKRVKHDHGDEAGEMKCYNCGRTKSSVWRSRIMDNGAAVKVCNACGLYWNARKEMRPPSMWGAVDDEVIERPRNPTKVTPRNPPPRPAVAAKPKPVADSTTSAAFKRTLSAAVDQDAKRIAKRRPSTAAPRSNLNPNKAAPATSPAQSTRAKTMRNVSWKNPQGEAASSPGGWVNPEARAVDGSEAFEPVPSAGESSAAGRQTFSSQSGIQSLQLPSDDQGGAIWDTDLSTLFDIDAFEENLDKFSEETYQQPLRRSPRKHNGRKQSEMDSDLFRNSPKSSFDFSALPPSSPPFVPGGHGGHGQISTLLMSSPDFSPMSSMFGPSPVESGSGVPVRLTPEKNKSGLRNSFTPVQEAREAGVGLGMGLDSAPRDIFLAPAEGDAPNMSLEEITKALNESGMDQAAWDELFGFMSEVEAGRGTIPDFSQSQVTGGDGGADAGDDWAALFTNLSQ